MSIRDTVESVSLIDNHAHPVEPLAESVITDSFAEYFTEGALSAVHARNTLNYRAALALLSEQFGGATEAELLKRRVSVDLESYCRELIARTDTETILVDDGYPDVSPVEFRAYTDATIHPILRLEPIIERLLPAHESFDDFVDAFRTEVENALDGEYVALKSIIAYRTGLDIADPDRGATVRAFERLRANWDGRIADPVVLEYLLHEATCIAAEYDVPIQLHTGFGDIDAHPRFVDPAYAYGFLRSHSDASIVLLHAGYPYVRNAGYVTSTLDNVYLDISLAIPFIQHGCEPLLEHVLELTPTTKLLYASDASSVPELYVLAANRVRTDLAAVLERLVNDGFLSETYAITTAENVLRENAIRLYDL
ncbi:amidohydrolase family protein [Haladaptatus sp. CMAA 1911]|uniref:amidohydrolase family protein n=1 Tax=unclassified Haladaptatus TaxID=2622732 RepID=UPI003754705E